MAGSTDSPNRWVLGAWFAGMFAFTIVAITIYYDNEKHIKKLQASLPESWPEAAWECSYPPLGPAQTLFKGSVLEQSTEAQDRNAFTPELRSACHHCRPEGGNRLDGHELLVPGGANATAGVSAAVLALRSGILTLGGFYNNANAPEVQAARCASADRGSFYMVWDDGGSELFVCYCRSGTEYCGDALFTDGASELNCVGASTTGLAMDCGDCGMGVDQLC